MKMPGAVFFAAAILVGALFIPSIATAAPEREPAIGKGKAGETKVEEKVVEKPARGSKETPDDKEGVLQRHKEIKENMQKCGKPTPC
jgi:hypothetical protein